MPQPLHAPQQGNAVLVNLLGATLVAMLKKNVQEPFQLTLLNIGVTNFVASKRGSLAVATNSPHNALCCTYCLHQISGLCMQLAKSHTAQTHSQARHW